MTRIQQSLLLALALLVPGTPAAAQTYTEQKPRRQLNTINCDWMNTLVGAFALQFAAKFAWNTLNDPVTDRFLTIPVTLRGTVSF
jgi:hypothetical protein